AQASTGAKRSDRNPAWPATAGRGGCGRSPVCRRISRHRSTAQFPFAVRKYRHPAQDFARRLPDRCRHGVDRAASATGEGCRRPGDRHAAQRRQGPARGESGRALPVAGRRHADRSLRGAGGGRGHSQAVPGRADESGSRQSLARGIAGGHGAGAGRRHHPGQHAGVSRCRRERLRPWFRAVQTGHDARASGSQCQGLCGRMESASL
ncbi:2-dehydro-3-deoxyphosphogalactonate aldolase (EC 4.1.2.21), partial [Pseudomonas fluorescens]